MSGIETLWRQSISREILLKLTKFEFEFLKMDVCD